MTPRRLVNLTFHGLGTPARALDGGEEPYWLPSDVFEGILDRVSSRDDVRLFFDDGNASDLEIALPALASRGLGATFFIVAANVGRPGFLGAEGVQALAAAGMGIGSHGMSHRSWRGLPPDELETEVCHSRELLEEMVGRPITHAACPFGAYDRAALRRLRDAGYERIFTRDRGPALADAWLQPRNSLRRFADENPLDEVDQHPSLAATAINQVRLLRRRWR